MAEEQPKEGIGVVATETEAPVKEVSKEEQYVEALQRLQAEFINYRKRVEKEQIMAKELGKNVVLLKFLEIKDNFERAPKLDEGMELVYKQFLKVFEDEGVEEIHGTSMFDPEIHEAIGTVDTHDRDTVVAVTRKGYKRYDQILRPVQVVVGCKEQTEETKHE